MTVLQFINLFLPEPERGPFKKANKGMLKKDVMYIRLDQMNIIADWMDIDNRDCLQLIIDEGSKQRCRICGCTHEDCSQCIEKTGEPCHWVEVDLCSACT